MAITLGGQTFTEAQVLAALAAQNTEAGTSPAAGTVDGILTALVANRLPITRAGFGVTTTNTATGVLHRVQVLDEAGRTIIISYEIPN